MSLQIIIYIEKKKIVSDKVEDHEKLRGGVIFVDDVPRSPAGKLKREELKASVRQTFIENKI